MAERQLQTVMRHLRRLASPSDCRLSDRDLLERFVSRRDEGAFAALVQRHGPMVLGVCRRVLHNVQDAEDACQAAFLVLARKAGSIRKRDCAGSWLHGVAYRIARNLSREVARRRARERAVEELSRSDPAGDLSWREVRAALDEEIDRLPERYRAPLVLCYLEGKTRDEAAHHLGWTLGTLRGRLEKGRELLRSRLVRRGLTLGGALLGSTLVPQAKAALSPSLLTATVQATRWTLTNPELPSSLVSAQAAALTKGALKTMALTKIKIAAGFLVALTVLGGGVGALTLGTLADEPAQAQKENQPAAKRIEPGPEKGPDKGQGTNAITERAVLTATASIQAMSFSPDGKVLATGSADGKVTLWDVRTGKVLMTFGSKQSLAIHAVKFSPDGKTVAVAGDATRFSPDAKTDLSLRVLNLSLAKQEPDFWGYQATVRSVAYSPDGKTLAATGDDSTVRLWDVSTGKELWTFGPGGGGSVAFTPDSRALWAADLDPTLRLFPTLRLLDAATGKEMRRIALSAPANPASSNHRVVVTSPDGKLLATAASNDSAVSLWETVSGKEVRRFLTHDQGVMSVAFSPDGRTLASAGEDRTVRLWGLATGKEVAVLKGHNDTVNSVVFSPDGSLLATGSADKTVKLWDLRIGRTAQRAPVGRADLANDPLEQLLDDLVKKQRNDQESIEALYLATLARFPTELELKFAMEHLGKKADRRTALGDLLFALTNSKDFSAYVESLGRRQSLRQH